MPKELNLTRFVRFSSLLPIVVGLFGLTGCFFHVQILRTVVPGLVAIAANTSLCFILLGISLWCLREQDRTSATRLMKWFGKAAAAIAGVIGLLSLAEFLGNLDLGIDQLLFTEAAQATLGHVRPGLMSPVTALDLLLLGAALLLLDWTTRRRTWPSQVLCFIAGILAVFTLLDLIIEPHHFRAHIALSTVTLLTLLPFAVICARPKLALGGLLLAPRPSRTLLHQFFSPSALLGEQRGGPLHYILAVVLTALATLLRYWLVGHISPGVMFITYVPAVMIAALAGGFGPGVLATVLSAACVDYYFLPPLHSFMIATREQLLELLMFIAIGVVLSWLASAVEQIREKAGEETRRAKEEWELTFNSVPEAVMVLDEEFRIRRANQAMCSLVNGPADAIIGKHCYELVHQTLTPVAGCPLRRMLHSRSEEEAEITEERFGKVFDVTASPLRENGCLRGCVHVIRDITGRKRAEEALRQSEERLQLQIERMPVACILWDRNFRVTSWNPAAEQIFGFKEEEALGRHPYEFIVPKSAQGSIDQVFQRLLEGDATAHSTNENLTADGRVITCHWTNTPVKGADGQTVAVLSMAEDITERMQTETRIKLERQRFESVLDGLPVMVCLLTPNYDVAFANHAFRKQFGESQGRKCYEYCYGKSSPCDFCQSFQVLKTGAPHDWEVTKEDGRIIHAFDVPFADVDGSPLVLEMDIDITQQRQAEQKLREASHYTRSLIEASLDPLVTISRDGKITDVNEATEKATGIPRDQLIGSDFAEYFTDSDKARQGYERVFIEGTVRDYPLAIRHTSGRLTDVLYNASLFHNQKGEVEGVFAAARDVTERKRAEEAVRKLNEELEQRVQERTVELERTRNILAEGQRIAHLGTFEYIAETKTTIWSEEEYRIYGLDPAGPSPDYATLMTRGFHPEDVAKLDQTFKAAMEKRSIYELEHRIVRPDGSVRWVYDLAYPYFDNGGKLVRYIGATLDITERKQAEAALRDKEELLRAVTDNSPDAIYVKDGSSRWLMANPAVLRIVGRTAEQALGKTDLELYADAAVGRAILENDRRTMEAGRTEEFEEVADTPDGRRTFLSVKAPRRDAHGNIVGLIGISHDITARKLVEEGVRESELRFRTLANTVPDLVWTCTPDGKCDFFSSRWIEYTGIPAEDQLGYAWLNQVHPDDRERLLSEWRQSLENDHPFDIEFRIRNHQGLYRWFKTRAVALRDQGGRVLKWFGTNTDIEDLRRSQQELTAANKELESFNYAVAHDLRAPLRHIHGFADLLAQDAAPVLNEASQKHLQIIRESVERMGQLLQELLNLSRLGRQELHKKSCDLNVLIQQVLAELKPEAANREIEWRVGDLPAVECDASLVKQVLLNLVSNAVKFTRKRRPAIIEIGQSMQNGVPAVFVRDNGEGFDMKYADKLFGIFQRLHRKEDFEGTGVGLAIVQRIVHRHGGSIWAEAELNRGATFYFSLQSCERERQNHRAAAEVA